MNRMIVLFTAFFLSLALSACSKTEEGTAEKAGKQIDQALEDAKSYTDEKMQQAGEKADTVMSDAKEYTGEKMEEAGEALEETGKELQQGN